jgi:hypothetical protein
MNLKPEDSFPEIGRILRSHKPDPPVAPDLEARILRAVNQRVRPPVKRRLWPWFALPPAFAAVALVLLLNRPQSEAPATTRNPPAPPLPRVSPAAEAAPDAIVSLVESANPLLGETAALSRDAKRVSGFLMDCLPSVATGND